MDSFGDNNLDNLMKDLANLTLNIIEECKKKKSSKTSKYVLFNV